MGNTPPLNKADASDKRRRAWIIMCEILHHFLLSVSVWDKEAECMECEGRERGGERYWKMMLYVLISHYFPRDFVVCEFMFWKFSG